MSLRLCSLAPWTTSSSAAIRSQSSPGRQREQVFALASVATPRPVLGTSAETGSNRVVQDVCASLTQVVGVADHPAAETVAEEVSRPAVALVELLGVGAVDDLHSRRQRLEIGFDDQFIYEQLPLEIATRSLPMSQIEREHSLDLFREWIAKPDKVHY